VADPEGLEKEAGADLEAHGDEVLLPSHEHPLPAYEGGAADLSRVAWLFDLRLASFPYSEYYQAS
jgi:hypothetical protein